MCKLWVNSIDFDPDVEIEWINECRQPLVAAHPGNFKTVKWRIPTGICQGPMSPTWNTGIFQNFSLRSNHISINANTSLPSRYVSTQTQRFHDTIYEVKQYNGLANENNLLSFISRYYFYEAFDVWDVCLPRSNNRRWIVYTKFSHVWDGDGA